MLTQVQVKQPLAKLDLPLAFTCTFKPGTTTLTRFECSFDYTHLVSLANKELMSTADVQGEGVDYLGRVTADIINLGTMANTEAGEVSPDPQT